MRSVLINESELVKEQQFPDLVDVYVKCETGNDLREDCLLHSTEASQILIRVVCCSNVCVFILFGCVVVRAPGIGSCVTGWEGEPCLGSCPGP